MIIKNIYRTFSHLYNTPNHFDLEQSCLTDTKISDVQRLFVVRENKYRPLITSLFENESFINDITAFQEYYNPISTQDIFLKKKQIIPSSSSTKIIPSSSSSTKIIPSSSSSTKKSKLKNYQKCCVIDRVQKIVVKTKKYFILKKAIGSQISRMDFLNDKTLKFENVNFLEDIILVNYALIINVY